MNKVVYILHGLGADSHSNWFPWLKQELKSKGYTVAVPDFPQSSTPQLAHWLEHLQKMIQQYGEGILVGHSLGGLLAIQYLLAGGQSSKIILTATPFHAISGMPEITAFLPDSKQLQRLANIGTEFVVIQSDDDVLVPIADGRRWAKVLGGRLVKLTGLGHLTIWEFPEILPYL